MIRVTVLGGSAAGGNTGMGCSGYLFEHGETRVVVDLGPGTMPELRKHCDFRELSAVVISHWHVDHYLDLAAFRFAAAYNPRPATRLIPLHMPPGGAAFLSRFGMTLPQDEQNPRFFDAIFAPGTPLTIGSMTLTFEPTIHFIPCWGVRIDAESGPSVGYTADTGPLPGLDRFFCDVDLLIAEATDLTPPTGPGVVGHLTAGQAGELATASNAGALLLTHIWEERGFDAAKDQASSTFSGRIHVARPGLCIEVGRDL